MSELRSRLYRLLRYFERYAKTDLIYLSKGGFWLMVGQGIQIASSVIVAIVFANLASKELFGTYQFVMSGAVIISAFTLTGMGTAVTRAIAHGSDGALRAGVRTQLAWSMGIIFAGAAAAVYYHINGNDTLALCFLIVGAFSPVLTGFGMVQSFFVGKQLFRESVLYGLWRRLIPVAAVLGALLLTESLPIIILTYFASHTLAAGLLYLLIVRRFNLPRSPEPGMVTYSKHLSLMDAFSTIANQADKVLIFHFLGAAPTAAYALAQLPVKRVESLFKLLLQLSFSKATRTGYADLKVILPSKARLMLLATAVTAGLYILAAPFLFGLLFPAYPESVLLSQVLALMLLAVPRSLYAQALTAHEKKRELYTLTVTQNVLRVILLLVFLPLYGIWGVVAALALTHLYGNITVRILFHRSESATIQP